MKRPNGYGSVYKLQGKRRKPYVVAITKKEIINGEIKRRKQIIGYYAHRKDAETALYKYNDNPYDTDITFAKVYELWSATKFNNIAVSTKSGYTHAYERFKPLHDKKFASLKVADLERVIQSADASEVNRRQMKVLLNQLYKYALKYDITNNNLSTRFSIKVPDTKLQRVPFSDEEIATLWQDDTDTAKAVLIMIYTGVRVAELYSMEIDTENWLLIGGVKTKAGKNRIVPIRRKIRNILDFDRDMSEHAFYLRVNEYLKSMGHLPHDCRVTFATRYKEADDTAIKLILGHAIQDITKGIYTKYTPDDLLAVVESVDF